MTEGHGDDRHRYPGLKIRYDFSSNVPASPDHDLLWAHLTEQRDLISRYPEPEPFTLQGEIALKQGVDPSNILVTNGATEAIFLIAHLFAHQYSAFVQPTFSEYRDAAKLFQHKEMASISAPWEQTTSYDAIWCCNPNNPTGHTWNKERLLYAIDNNPHTTFILDQSYYAFTAKEVISHAEIAWRQNVIGIFSLTKKYALPGLRLGYVVASPSTANALRRLRMPWSVNALAIESGRFLLHKEPFWSLQKLLSERERVTSEIIKDGAITIYPSDTHFFLAKLPEQKYAQDLKEWLVREHGILIRNADNFLTLTPQHFRIAIQSPEANDCLINALALWNQL